MKNIYLTFKGIDDFNRPIFKDINSKAHYGDTCKLYSWDTPPEEVIKHFSNNDSELCYFGEHFNCEPYGTREENTKFIILTVYKTYQEMTQAHSTRVNDFPFIFWAFSNEQFAEGKKKIGIEEDSEILSTGAGGYIRKDKKEDYFLIFETNQAERELHFKNPTFLQKAMDYEMGNHEYIITGDDSEIYGALGLQEDEDNYKIFIQARKNYFEHANI